MAKKNLSVIAGVLVVGLLGFAVFVQAKSFPGKDAKQPVFDRVEVSDRAAALSDDKNEKADFVCGDTVNDTDGNSYGTVSIGSQCWMNANLRAKKNPDGTCINGGSAPCPNASSADNGKGRSCYGNNEAVCTSMGALYTLTAAMNGSTDEGARGICPVGFHVPTDAEFATLEQFLTTSGTCDPDRVEVFGCSGAGSAMVISGTSGFDMHYAGVRNHNNGFINIGYEGLLWSSSVNWDLANGNVDRGISSSNTGVIRDSNPESWAQSLRCIRD